MYVKTSLYESRGGNSIIHVQLGSLTHMLDSWWGNSILARFLNKVLVGVGEIKWEKIIPTQLLCYSCSFIFDTKANPQQATHKMDYADPVDNGNWAG